MAEPLDHERTESRPTPAPWFVVEDDDIGGWAVANTDAAPSRHDPERGHRMIANFNRREDAELVVALRNLASVDLHRQLEEQGETARG